MAMLVSVCFVGPGIVSIVEVCRRETAAVLAEERDV